MMPNTPAASTGGTAMPRAELERRALERARAERVRIVKLAGQERYLARSRTVEPGAYFELSVSWGRARCSCPGYSYRGVCKHAAALQARINQQQRREDHEDLR